MERIKTDEREMLLLHEELTQTIIGVFYDVYNELGYGFLESVYREAMRVALAQIGLTVETEIPIPVSFRGAIIGIFRADLILNSTVLVELKASESLIRQHESQTLNYLRATKIEVALLMNFGPVPHFKRLVMSNALKQSKKSAQSAPIRVKPSSSEPQQ